MAYELTTLSAVKDWLGVSGTSEDVRIGRCLSASETMIRGICNREDGWLTGTSHTQRFETVNANALSLTYTPVTVLSSVTLVYSSGSTYDMSSSNYRLDTNGRVLRLNGDPLATWTGVVSTGGGGAQSVPPYQWANDTTVKAYPYIKVVYAGGYASQASVPADLAQVAIEGATLLYRGRSVDRNLKSEDLGNYGYTTASPSEVREYLTTLLGDYICITKGYFG